jgi:hypothetical protein
MSKEAYAAKFNPPRPPDDGLDAVDRARLKSERQQTKNYAARKPILAKLYPHWKLNIGEPS